MQYKISRQGFLTSLGQSFLTSVWLLSFWVQNLIISTIVRGFGVILLIVVAIGMNNIFGEFDDNNTNLKIELEKLKKEIDELKKMKDVVG